MNSIEFINDAYTEDGLKLPMVHFNSKDYMIHLSLQYHFLLNALCYVHKENINIFRF